VGQAKEKVVGCFGDIPICVFRNFGAAESCGRLCDYNYVNDYVSKGILTSPMYIYNKNGGGYMGCRGGVQSKIVATSTTNATY
jgi:hypothetical protein